jgi:hypothetical protein
MTIGVGMSEAAIRYARMRIKHMRAITYYARH